MAQSQRDDKSISVVLNELKNATDKHQCRRVKLISYFLGLSWNKIEKSGYCIPDIYYLLTKHSSLRSQAIAILQSILEMVGVDADTVAKLGSTEKELEGCKKLQAFPYVEMILTVILQLGEEHFKDLRSFFIHNNYLGATNPSNIETPEDLFRRLHQAEIVYPQNVELLVSALKELQLNDVARIAQEYQNKYGRTSGHTSEARSKQQPLRHQINCHQETEQSQGRTQMVGPGLNRVLSCPGNMSSNDRFNGSSNNSAQLDPSSDPLTFSGLADGERDGVHKDGIETSSPPKRTDLPMECARGSINNDLYKEPRPPSTTTTTTTTQQPNEIVSQPKCRRKCSSPSKFICTILLVLMIVIGFGSLGLHLVERKLTKEQIVLGKDNDTIIVGKVTGSFVKRVNVSECLEQGDYSHVSQLFVTLTLTFHQRNITGGRSLRYLPDPLKETGLLDYVYLLNGSVVDYTMCVASVTDDSDGLIGNLYIFNDLLSYERSDTSKALVHRTLQFGTNNQTVCTSIKSYTVTQTGYYFITSTTPGNIVYKYSYNIRQLYLDPDDYNEATKDCPSNVYEPVSCVLNVKGGDYVLAHIEKPVAADPFTTHLRLQPMSVDAVHYVLIGSAIVVGVCLLAVLAVFVHILYECSHRHRNDYEPL